MLNDFEEAGFENIEVLPLKDLDSGTEQDRIVKSITISNDENFDENQRFRKNTPIRITYHDFSDKAIYSDKLKIENKSEDTKEKFVSQGFKNVKIKKVELEVGPSSELNKQTITIDGQNMKEDFFYSKDSKVVISETILSPNALVVEKLDIPDPIKYSNIVESLKKEGFNNISLKAFKTTTTSSHDNLKQLNIDEIKYTTVENTIFKKDLPVVVEYFDASEQIVKEKKEAEEKERIAREEKEKEEREEKNKRVKLEVYYNSIQDAIDTVNSQLGMTAVERIQQTSVTPGIEIYLGYTIASYSITEIQIIISTLNQSLVSIARSQGVSPRFYYYLGGQEVAVNRYITAPDEVKFTGILKR